MDHVEEMSDSPSPASPLGKDGAMASTPTAAAGVAAQGTDRGPAAPLTSVASTANQILFKVSRRVCSSCGSWVRHPVPQSGSASNTSEMIQVLGEET